MPGRTKFLVAKAPKKASASAPTKAPAKDVEGEGLEAKLRKALTEMAEEAQAKADEAQANADEAQAKADQAWASASRKLKLKRRTLAGLSYSYLG
jgi:predicted  nucleic acid-binding Zn-ribbon protein